MHAYCKRTHLLRGELAWFGPDLLSVGNLLLLQGLVHNLKVNSRSSRTEPEPLPKEAHMRAILITLSILLTLCFLGNAADKTKEKKPHVRVTTSASGFEPKAVATPADTKFSSASAPLTLEPPKPADPVAPTIKPPDSGVQDPIEQTNLLVKAVRSKEWGVVVGIVLMLVVWGVGWFWSALPNSWIPTLAIVLGVTGTVGVELSFGGVWWRAILSGLTTGITSTGCWEAFGKQLLGSRKNALVKKAAKTA